MTQDDEAVFVIPQDGEDKLVTPQTALEHLCKTVKATAEGQVRTQRHMLAFSVASFFFSLSLLDAWQS